MANSVSLNEIKHLVQQLPWRDKLRLIEWIAPQIERDLPHSDSAQPLPTLQGLWRGADVSEADIEAMRAEMWADMPREDV